MNLAGIVLAAGLGKRMNSSLPKVLHTLHGVPMLQYVVDTLHKVKLEKIIAVVGKHAGLIRDSLHNPGTLSYVEQKEARGTGDALLQAVSSLKNFHGTAIVVNGDTPLLTEKTIRNFLTQHRRKKHVLSLLSFIAADPGSYGRIMRDKQGTIMSIVENRDATATQRDVREVNSGVYAIEPKALRLIKEIKMNKPTGEYYLTDIVHRHGRAAAGHRAQGDGHAVLSGRHGAARDAARARGAASSHGAELGAFDATEVRASRAWSRWCATGASSASWRSGRGRRACAADVETCRPVARARDTALTPRELDVLQLVVDGKTNAEIGFNLGISEKTVEKHLDAIFRKMGVVSRVEEAVMAVRQNLFGEEQIKPTR